jgi:hypothetical protein
LGSLGCIVHPAAHFAKGFFALTATRASFWRSTHSVPPVGPTLRFSRRERHVIIDSSARWRAKRSAASAGWAAES